MDIITRNTINNLTKVESFDSSLFLLNTLKDIYSIVYSNNKVSSEDKLLEIRHVFDSLRNNSQILHQKRGTLFSNTFKNISLLGEGGYGLVYKGTHYLDNNEYAIKRLPIYISLRHSQKISTIVLEKLREIRYLSKLNHPNIISYNTSWLETDNEIYKSEFDDEMDEDFLNYSNDDLLLLDNDTTSKISIQSNKFLKFQLFYQMELMDCSLRDILNDELLRTNKNYKTILTGVLNALNYLHTQCSPIIHLDIKPENILLKLDENNNIISVKLVDFGLSHQVSHIEPINKIGTEIYSSPERKLGILHTNSDIYSLGIILCEMLYFWKTDMERIKEIEKIKIETIDKLNDFPIIIKMISTDYLKRPSAKNLLKLCDSIFSK
jgi:serine/threonine protein kinase